MISRLKPLCIKNKNLVSTKTTPNNINVPKDNLRYSQLQEALDSFVENHPINRLTRNLRTMLLEYLQHEGATESLYLQDLLFDLAGLFELLEVIASAEDQTQQGN